MVHKLSWGKVSTSTTSFELPSESTRGQTWSTYQVCDKWPTCQAADQSATQTLNCGNTSRSSKNSTFLKLNSSTRHKPNGCHPPPSSTRLGWRFSETSHGPLPPERRPPAEGIDPPRLFSWTQFGFSESFVGRGCVVCLQLLLKLVGVAEGVSPVSFNLGVSHS